jgi:excisionase family DNA binding protein
VSEPNDYVKILSVASEHAMTTQAIYESIRKGILDCKVIDGIYHVSKAEFEKYLKSRYKRKIVPPGELSVKMAAKAMGVSEMTVYQHIRTKRLPHYRNMNGSGITIRESDIRDFLKKTHKREP